MGEITRGAIVRVGVDLAERVIQVHAVDAPGRVVTARPLARDKFMPWCAQLPPGCTVAMEACGGAHHWARRLRALGLVFAQSPEALRLALPEAIEDASNELPTLARLAVQRAHLSWLELDCHIAWCDERIAAHVRADEQARAAAQLCGVGPVTASAIVSSVGDFTQFKSGSQFGAWLGLVPGQHSSGGKPNLGRITKRGDDYLRTLLIQGAKSAVMTAHKRSDRISQWLVQLLARVGWQKAVVAMANKNARILWAVLAKGRRFDANHLSGKKTPPVPPTTSVGPRGLPVNAKALRAACGRH